MNDAPPKAKSRDLALLFVAAVLFAASLPAFHQQAFGTRISDIPEQFSIGRSGLHSVYSVLYLLVHGLLAIGADDAVMGWVAASDNPDNFGSPTLTNVASSALFLPQHTLTVSPAITVSDPDNFNLTNATVKITGGTFDQPWGRLPHMGTG